MGRGRWLLVTGAVIFAMSAAACSNGSTTPNGPAGGGSTGAASSVDAGGSNAAAADGTVAVTNGDLGQMLVDSQGRTLYMFLSDTGTKSTCYSDCAANWPALTTDGAPKPADGVDASMLGTTRRTDGTTQVTFDGHPLYLFAGDAAAGDTNGEGIGKVWYAVAPDGTPIKKSGGYGGRY